MKNKIKKDKSLSLLTILLILVFMIIPAQSDVSDFFISKSNIEKVKSAVLKAYPQTTIGKAMDNWKACDNRLWEEGETANGTNVVQFKCEITDFRDMREYFDKANSENKKRGVTQSFTKNNNFQQLNYILFVIQWIINVDGTISTSYANQEAIVWKDGTGKKLSQQVKESDNEIIHNILTMAYNNTGGNVLEFFGNDFAGFVLGELYMKIEMAEKFINAKSTTEKNIQTETNQKNSNLVLQNLQNHLRKNDKHSIAKLVQYPLNRTNPLPSIQSKEEFVNKFDHIFDDTLKQIIFNARGKDITTAMGGREDMLKNGTLWFSDGKIIVINYQTDKEKKLIQDITALDKSSIHESLKDFKRNEYIIKTETFKIRIDEIDEYQYRYASWSNDQMQSEKPSLILNNGEAEAKGAGEIFMFENGIYTYYLYVDLSRGNNHKGYLEISKNGKLIVEQDILEIK